MSTNSGLKFTHLKVTIVTKISLRKLLKKKCTVSEDKTKYYSCEYADTTCEAVFFADGKTSYVLCNGIENVPENKKNLVYDRVKVDAKSNRCRDLNPPKPVTTTH